MKIAVLASTRGTVLQAILDEMKAGTLPGVELSAVVSDVKDAGALEKARAAGVEAVFVSASGKSKEAFEEELSRAIGEVDLVCLIGFMRILSPSFVKKYEGRILNVHPSLLPKYGGKGWIGDKVHEAVLANEDRESGMSIHFVEEGVDSGEVLLQKTCPVLPDDSVERLRERVQELEKVAYPEAIRLIQAQRKDKLGHDGL